MICLHCKERVVWIELWNAWEHKARPGVVPQLCEPEKGELSTYASPSFGE